MLLGEFPLRIDQKGRLAIPAKFRPEFKEGLVLTRGFDPCLNAYPLLQWRRVYERLTTRSSLHSTNRTLRRFTFSQSFDLELDAQGRILLPASLRSQTRLGEEVVVVGAGDYLEVWSRELWEAEKARMAEKAPELAEGLEE